ncbi:MAG: hypothetical protein LC730_04120, partial [Acidobacteria bacterium]|nr:hypothetical protein [Acidobacteriota bacterium]MCA1608631.1 hypothetical protein [Acidobacteriota bacterium]
RLLHILTVTLATFRRADAIEETARGRGGQEAPQNRLFEEHQDFPRQNWQDAVLWQRPVFLIMRETAQMIGVRHSIFSRRIVNSQTRIVMQRCREYLGAPQRRWREQKI